ncbi:MAG: TIGR03936 family radical SAM-associated protein [Chloroflexota bacterium]
MSTEQDGVQPIQRLRFTFSKDGPARYISHLDLARTLERVLNRSRIPLAYSQGFNRRPRLSLAAALPLGYTSEAELADIWLTEQVEPVVALEQIINRMAPGIAVQDMVDIPLKAPSLQQILQAAAYRVRFLDPVDAGGLQERVAALLAQESLPRERKRRKDKRPKPYDLRPLIIDLGVEPGGAGSPILTMHLVQTPTETGRPDEVLDSLGFDPLDTHVHRTQLYLAESDAA